jgi:hypothetical protein
VNRAPHVRQNIDAAEALQRGCHGAFTSGCVGHVESYGQRPFGIARGELLECLDSACADHGTLTALHNRFREGRLNPLDAPVMNQVRAIVFSQCQIDES